MYTLWTHAASDNQSSIFLLVHYAHSVLAPRPTPCALVRAPMLAGFRQQTAFCLCSCFNTEPAADSTLGMASLSSSIPKRRFLRKLLRICTQAQVAYIRCSLMPLPHGCTATCCMSAKLQTNGIAGKFSVKHSTMMG